MNKFQSSKSLTRHWCAEEKLKSIREKWIRTASSDHRALMSLKAKFSQSIRGSPIVDITEKNA